MGTANLVLVHFAIDPSPGVCHSGCHRQLPDKGPMVAFPAKLGLFASMLLAAILITVVVAINVLFSVSAI